MGGCSAALKIAGGKWVGAQGSENGVGGGGYPNSEQPGHGPGEYRREMRGTGVQNGGGSVARRIRGDFSERTPDNPPPVY